MKYMICDALGTLNLY